MKNPEFPALSRLIRQLMKARKLTYESLAIRLGMSGSGLKKLLAAPDCSLGKLAAICECLEIELGELLKTSRELKSTEIKFSPKQEEFFRKHPEFFYFFWELIDDDLSLEQLRVQYGLDERSVRGYLSALDKLGLIELHPRGAIKHRYGGKTHWNMVDSAIGQQAMIKFQDGFLRRLRIPSRGAKTERRRILRWINFKLRPQTYEEFVVASQELVQEFIRRSMREKPLSRPEELMPVGMLLGISEFRFSDILQIPKL